MNIIGISGRAESGKDTVANMVLELTSRTYDAFDGGLYRKSEWEIHKFASKLKQVASILTGIPIEKFEDQDFKKTKLGSEWEMTYGLIGCMAVPIHEHSINDKKNKIFNTPMDVRTFLQKLGTDAIRNNLHGDAWVNALWADYKLNSETFISLMDEECRGFYTSESVQNKLKPKWLITDVRFPNEYQSIKDRGGVVVRLTRYGDLTPTHESEMALDNYDFDYIIDNRNLSFEALYEEVKKMLVHFDIINDKK